MVFKAASIEIHPARGHITPCSSAAGAGRRHLYLWPLVRQRKSKATGGLFQATRAITCRTVQAGRIVCQQGNAYALRWGQKHGKTIMGPAAVPRSTSSTSSRARASVRGENNGRSQAAVLAAIPVAQQTCFRMASPSVGRVTHST
jgi:hypothetical protein